MRATTLNICDEAGTPADSTNAAHCNESGFQHVPVGSSPSMLHETVAVREAVYGPKRPILRRKEMSASGGIATVAGLPHPRYE